METSVSHSISNKLSFNVLKRPKLPKAELRVIPKIWFLLPSIPLYFLFVLLFMLSPLYFDSTSSPLFFTKSKTPCIIQGTSQLIYERLMLDEQIDHRYHINMPVAFTTNNNEEVIQSINNLCYESRTGDMNVMLEAQEATLKCMEQNQFNLTGNTVACSYFAEVIEPGTVNYLVYLTSTIPDLYRNNLIIHGAIAVSPILISLIILLIILMRHQVTYFLWWRRQTAFYNSESAAAESTKTDANNVLSSVSGSVSTDIASPPTPLVDQHEVIKRFKKEMNTSNLQYNPIIIIYGSLRALFGCMGIVFSATRNRPDFKATYQLEVEPSVSAEDAAIIKHKSIQVLMSYTARDSKEQVKQVIHPPFQQLFMLQRTFFILMSFVLLSIICWFGVVIAITLSAIQYFSVIVFVGYIFLICDYFILAVYVPQVMSLKNVRYFVTQSRLVECVVDWLGNAKIQFIFWDEVSEISTVNTSPDGAFADLYILRTWFSNLTFKQEVESYSKPFVRVRPSDVDTIKKAKEGYSKPQETHLHTEDTMLLNFDFD